MIKAFIVSIIRFLEVYLGPIYGPITGVELNVITGKVEINIYFRRILESRMKGNFHVRFGGRF